MSISILIGFVHRRILQNYYPANIWRHYFQLNFHGIGGQESFYQLRPFYPAIPGIVEQVFDTNIEGLLRGMQPIQIKMMKKRYAIISQRVSVLIDQGKGGAGRVSPDPQILAEGFDQSGFTSAHFPIKGDFPPIAQHVC